MPKGQYILRGHKPVPCDDPVAWANWFGEGMNRIVKQEIVMAIEKDIVREVQVSTVFLGLDYNFNGEGLPVLFETMVIGGVDNHQKICERCCTWKEAEAQHERVKKYIMGEGHL